MPDKINEGDKKQQELILVEAARYGTTSEASRVPSEPYRNPADIKIDVFKKMKRTDDTVKSGLYFVELAVVSKMGEYVNESNPEIQAFVRTVFQEMKGTLAGAVRRILSARWAGFSVSEIVWSLMETGTFAGKVGISKIKTIDPESVGTNGIILDEFGNVTEIAQFRGSGKETKIPLSKVILFSNEAEFGNPYGDSCLRSVYKNWFSKDHIIRFWNIFLERYGSPIPMIKVPIGRVPCPIHGVEESTLQVASEIAAVLGQKNSLAILTDWEAEFLESKNSRPSDYMSSVSYHDKHIYRGILIPSLLADEGDHGARAQGDNHLELFGMVISDLIDTVQEEILLEQLLKPLIRYNYPDVEDFGRIDFKPVTQEDLKKWADVIKILTDAGYMAALNEEDARAVRDKMGLPGPSVGVGEKSGENVSGTGEPPESGESGGAGKSESSFVDTGGGAVSGGKVPRKDV